MIKKPLNYFKEPCVTIYYNRKVIIFELYLVRINTLISLLKPLFRGYSHPRATYSDSYKEQRSGSYFANNTQLIIFPNTTAKPK